MFFHFLITLFMLFFSLGCSSDSEDTEKLEGKKSTSLERSERIKNLESEIKTLRWEITRLTLKMRTVNGSSLVKDKKTGLWHYDVERVPFTGRALESYPDGSPRAEANFLNGQKDGMERFWYPNGKIKEEGQWFDGLANGIMSTWDEEGRPERIVRYKKGDLIEILTE